jgi:putative Mn2+ efflux pump MntP
VLSVSTIISFILAGFGLAADASSVSLVYGAGFKPFKWRYAMVLGAAFGIAQGLMPILGWLGGELIVQYIEAIDHWIAFTILVVVGGKFIWESFHENEVKTQKVLRFWPILLAAFATSIDACAVGFSLSMTQSPIIPASIIFAVVTFLCCIVCCRIGAKLGERYGNKLLLAGGIILILIGTKILIEHLFPGFLPF